MKVKTLLAKAAKCKTQEDVNDLLDTLQEEVGNARALAHLPFNNAEANLEGWGPYVRFELFHKISDDYITSICPEIRGGQFAVAVRTDHMLDGLGTASQCWETVEGMHGLIQSDGDQTIAFMAKRAKELALANHVRLLERVGVPQRVAFKIAKQAW